MPLHYFRSNRSRALALPKQGGFGLVELMVTIGIISLVTGIILIRQTSFNSAVLLRNQAYEVALQVRDVQMSAVSATNDANISSFRSVLGLRFDKASGNNQQYPVFFDQNNDYSFDAGEEYGSAGIFDPRFEIQDILIDGVSATNPVSVTFERPNFDAIFYSGAGVINAGAVEIVIGIRGETGGEQRGVEITSTGQISVN